MKFNYVGRDFSNLSADTNCRGMSMEWFGIYFAVFPAETGGFPRNAWSVAENRRTLFPGESFAGTRLESEKSILRRDIATALRYSTKVKVPRSRVKLS